MSVHRRTRREQPPAPRDELVILRITIPSRRLRLGLVLTAVALLLASSIVVALDTATRTSGGSVREAFDFVSFWLNVNYERNLPAWYSSILLVVVALVAWDLARVERVLHRSPWWAWACVAVTFACLSMDELLQMHEQSSTLAVLLLPLIVLFALATLPLLRALPRRIAFQLIGAGAVFVGGSLGMELIGNLLAETSQLLIHLEEAAELIGTALVLAAIAEYREALDHERVDGVAARHVATA
ncbi:hypothetical protein B0T42_06100 [Rathayibacter sp. VKM Ac-2630]|nr:hypothetical protein B0T42_06100 [Rathayibacter sp. VKM Ac-2630]